MVTLLTIGTVLMALGILGSIIPAMPGPVLSFIGLILLYFGKAGSVSDSVLVMSGIGMIVLIVIDYLAPILGAKFSGASKKGLWGSIIGCFLGIIFFPPLGIFLGAFLGAFLGELFGGKKPWPSLRAGIGTLLGSVLVIILQAIYSLILAVYFVIKLFS